MNNLLLKKVDKKTTEIERKARKIGKKIRIYAVVGAILIGLTVAFYLFVKISAWYDENKVIFQSPIIFQAPIKIERRYTPVKKETRKDKPSEAIILAYPKEFEEAYDLVWLRESGRGTNKAGLNGYCISKGMINEIGYSPHDNYCFKDRTEQKETFMLWLKNRLNHVRMPWCDSVSECILNYTANGYTL